MLRTGFVSFLVLGAVVAASDARGVETYLGRRNFFRLNGSADWEIFRSDGESGGVPSTYDSFRQRYSLDFSGSIWDHRFNRYALGVDFYRDDRRIADQRSSFNDIGYRVETTFFPSRPFPFRIYARRSSLDASGLAYADNDRDSNVWGAEWNLSTRRRQSAHVQFDRTAYNLSSPVALEERRQNGVAEFTQRYDSGEASIRYNYSDVGELVRDTRFTRHDLFLNDRTHFGSGWVIVLNGTQTASDARFSTGEEDSLDQTRLSASLDRPRRDRVGFGIGYDFYDTNGAFLDSTSHQGRANLRVGIGRHWETSAGGTFGRVVTRTAVDELHQDSTGANVGIRYNQGWSRLNLSAAYTFGLTHTVFTTEPERTLTSHGGDLHLDTPVGRSGSVFATGTIRKDQNDVTGVGYSYDELVVRAGVEGVLGEDLRSSATAYRRVSTYDTFQFGIQDSTEYGVEGTLGQDRGGFTLTAAKRDGISEFIPDPGGGGPLLPGTDLTSAANIVTAGLHWRFRHRVTLRAQVRYEDREFTTIGRETILSYHPQVEWSPGAWRFLLGVTHYERDNTTAFRQDTFLIKASRRFF